jgi:heme/copper-type cytochrome/quinol oxidase subunit 4
MSTFIFVLVIAAILVCGIMWGVVKHEDETN